VSSALGWLTQARQNWRGLQLYTERGKPLQLTSPIFLWLLFAASVQVTKCPQTAYTVSQKSLLLNEINNYGLRPLAVHPWISIRTGLWIPDWCGAQPTLAHPEVIWGSFTWDKDRWRANLISHLHLVLKLWMYHYIQAPYTITFRYRKFSNSVHICSYSYRNLWRGMKDWCRKPCIIVDVFSECLQTPGVLSECL
jgi:hypothetical protein